MCKARNSYRKFCRNKRKKYQIDKAQELYDLSKTNTAHFWSKVKSKKNNTGNCDFYSHFKKLYSLNQPLSSINVESSTQSISVDCLDREINASELERAILNLNNNKACGQDGILNEFIKNSNDQIKKLP